MQTIEASNPQEFPYRDTARMKHERMVFQPAEAIHRSAADLLGLHLTDALEGFGRADDGAEALASEGLISRAVEFIGGVGRSAADASTA